MSEISGGTQALLERDGWTSFYVWDWKLKDGSPDGFRAEAFKRQNKDHSYTYVLAFAGTDDAHDAAVDYWNAIHKMTNQYEFAMRIGERFALEFGEGNSQVLFVGHSLGGGLATAAAIVTGRRAITYNAAGLSEVVLNAYTKTSGARGSLNDLQPQQIVAHVINGELVSTHQNVIPGLPDTVGEIVTWDPSVSMRDLNFALNGANFGSRLGPGKAKILTAPLGAWIGYSGSRHMVDNFYRGIKLRAPASND